MKNILIGEADQLYKCSNKCVTLNYQIPHQAFHQLCQSSRHMEHSLGEQAQDDYWKDIFQEIKRFRFKLCAAPLPFDEYAKPVASFLENQKKQCQIFYPSFVPSLQNLIDKFNNLKDIADNPLLDQILKLVEEEDNQHVGLLLKETYLIPMVKEVFANYPSLQQVEVVSTYQLRGPQWFEKLFLIGPKSWYPKYIFQAPRTEKLCCIRYNWIFDAWKPQPIFIQGKQILKGTKEFIPRDLERSMDERNSEQEHITIPEINWHRVSGKILRNMQGEQTQEDIEAKLYILAHNQAVFLEASEQARAQVLDLEPSENDDIDEETHHIRRVPVAKLHPGLFLLLRTEGGGDYVVSIAENLLGKDANRLKELQNEWKERLRTEVNETSLRKVNLKLLINGGSSHANELNLQYWISDRSIRPQDDSDFRAILKLTGLQDKEKQYFEAASKIDSARRRAGFYIRKKLLEQVKSASTSDIHKQGFMEFELPQADGGSITAFRIEHISPTTSTIPASRIGRPMLAKDF